MDLVGHGKLSFKTDLALRNVTIRYFLETTSYLVKKNRIMQRQSKIYLGMILGAHDEKKALG
jgi:tRNA A22 N-methylase